MRILLVEDEALIALAAEDALIDMGHEVIGPYSSVDEAIKAAKSNHPDLALVDIDLCGKNDGLEVAHRLKVECGVNAIFASGQADVARTHRADVLGVLHKPYDAHALQLTIPVLEEVMKGGSPPPPRVPQALELF